MLPLFKEKGIKAIRYSGNLEAQILLSFESGVKFSLVGVPERGLPWRFVKVQTVIRGSLKWKGDLTLFEDVAGMLLNDDGQRLNPFAWMESARFLEGEKIDPPDGLLHKRQIQPEVARQIKEAIDNAFKFRLLRAVKCFNRREELQKSLLEI